MPADRLPAGCHGRPPEDIEKDGYNPLRYRFMPVEASCRRRTGKRLAATPKPDHLCYNPLEGPWGKYCQILTLGFLVTQMVFSGRWKDMKGHAAWFNQSIIQRLRRDITIYSSFVSQHYDEEIKKAYRDLAEISS